MNVKKLLAVAAVVGCAATPALVEAAGVQVDASANIAQAIAITKGSDLAFGTIIPSATAPGTVAISQAGVRTTTGVTGVPGGTITAATFTINGENNASYSLTIPATVTLSSGGDSMTATLNPSLDPNQSQTMGSSATALNVGASLAVGQNQAAGAYTAQFNVTVAYN